MAIRTVMFDVEPPSEASEMAWGLRLACVDFIRDQYARKINAAEDADVDKVTAARKVSMTYAKAARGYKLPRSILPNVVSWCGYAELNGDREGFPVASKGTLGTFDVDAIRTLPGGIALVKIGGVEFAGTITDVMDRLPADLFEIRIARKPNGKYVCVLLCGRPEDGATSFTIPTEGTPVDAE